MSDKDFSAVYDEHVWHVYGFLAYRLGQRADAEDLTQLTFERALRAWSRFDPKRATPRTWLLAIARNLLIDHYRRRESRPEDPTESDSLPEEIQDEGDWPANVGPSPDLVAGLATLTERDREVIGLRFGADLTGPEIADELGLTLANVQQILSRSLRRLRAQLEEREGEAATGTSPPRRDVRP